VLRAAISAAAAAPDPPAHASFAGKEWDVARYASQPPTTFCSGQVTAMAMYAGTGVEHITSVTTVADVVRELFPGLTG